MAQIHWATQASDDFSVGARWKGGVVPGSADDAILDAPGTTNYTVTASTNHDVHSIQTASTATLAVTVANGSGGFFADAGTGTGANAGAIVVGNNSNLIIGGTFNNAGTVSLNSAGNVTSLQIEAGGATLTGTGKVFLTDNGQNQIFGDTSTATLTNVSNTIAGAGRIGNGQTVLPGAGGLKLVNQSKGVIVSQGANQLIINTGANTATNAGLLESQGAGGLLIQSTTVNNVGGTIEGSSGTAVQLQGADIIGGTLASTGGGVVETAANDHGSMLDGVTAVVSNTGTLALQNNTFLTIQGAISNSGKINLDSVGNVTELVVSAKNATITGGAVNLTDNSQNFVVGTLTGPRGAQAVSSLVNAATIAGAGSVGGNLSLTNNSVIDATGANQLILATGASVVAGSNLLTNNGTLESTNPGKLGAVGGLILNGVTVTNNSSTGLIEANGAHTHVDLEAATIVGGTLTTLAGGVIQTFANDRGSLLDGTTSGVKNTGSLVLQNNTSLTVQGAILNTSTITLNSAGNVTDLVVSAKNATIAGGAVTLSDNSQNFIVGTVTGPVNHQTVSTLTNNSVLSGSGTIGTNLTLVNVKTIDATGGNALIIATGRAGVAHSNFVSNDNKGILESTNPGKLTTVGGLVLSGVTIFNSTSQGNAFIEANGAHTHVDLQSATIIGGVINATLGGVIQTAANDRGSVLLARSATVFNETTININNNTALTLAGQLSNKEIALNSAGNVTDFIIDAGGGLLAGGGTVLMSDNSQNRILANLTSNGPAGTLTNRDNTILGGGQLGAGQLTLINQAAGVIDGTATTNALILNTGAAVVTNSGLIEATGVAGLTIQNTIVDSSSGGKLLADNSSPLNLQGATLIGGTLLSGTGVFQTAANDRTSVFDGTTSTINNQAQVNLQNNTSLTLQGNMNNTGGFNLNSAGNVTQLIIDITGVTLTGGGSVALGSNGQNYLTGVTAGSTLTNVDNTISGGGQLGGGQLTLVNDKGGTIDADTAGLMTLNVGASTAINNGLIEATNTGGLLIQNSTVDSSGGGTIDSESVINLQNAFLIGGTLTGAGVFQTQANDFLSVLDGIKAAVTNNGAIDIINNTALTLQGAIHNNSGGTINLQSGGNITQLIVDVTGATLSGGGSVTMGNNSQNFIVGNTAAATLTNVDNTISGSGDIGDGNMTLVNGKAGLIDAVNPITLTLDTGVNTIANAGVLQADTTGTLAINSIVNNTGTVDANGGLVLANAAITGTGAVTINSGEIEFSLANVATNVAFTTTNGTLRLDHSQTYTGKVTGFSTSFGTQLDLSDIGFVGSGEATYVDNGKGTGGVLTVTDGTHTAHITLVGNYTSSTFTAAADGHGGTTVTDPPRGGSTTASAHHQFVAAMAAFGGASAVAHVTQAAQASVGPLLALPTVRHLAA